MLDKIKNSLTPKKITCSNCGREIEEGERFTAHITMPSEKNMLVSRFDNGIARIADRVFCEKCQ